MGGVKTPFNLNKKIMYLQKEIQVKFILEVRDSLLDSIDNYSEYIKENKNLDYTHELAMHHLIGYNACEKFLTNDGRFSAFTIVSDWIEDTNGEFNVNLLNSETIYHYYFSEFMNDLTAWLNTFTIVHEPTDKVRKKYIEKQAEVWTVNTLRKLGEWSEGKFGSKVFIGVSVPNEYKVDYSVVD